MMAIKKKKKILLQSWEFADRWRLSEYSGKISLHVASITMLLQSDVLLATVEDRMPD